MRALRPLAPALLLVNLVSVPSAAQAPPEAPAVPRLVHLSGVFQPGDGTPAAPVEEVTLGIYAEASGGVPLWQETQSLALDAAGRYAVLLGATQTGGVPLAVVASGEPRYLGLVWTRAPHAEFPRVRLTSVPYALRASDADTLGGLPASAFLRVDGPDGSAAGAGAKTDAEAASTDRDPTPAVNTGTANYLGKFVNALDLTSSVLFEDSGRVGLGTTAPFDMLHTRFTNTSGALTGVAVQNLGNSASSYSGMLFYDQNGVLGQFQGFNNVTHEYRINNIAASGSINFMLGGTSRFLVRPDGDIDISSSVRQGGFRLLHTTGSSNTALGRNALNALDPNAGGGENTAVGKEALLSNTGGFANVAVGSEALEANTSGQQNVAVGALALKFATTASHNTAVGDSALLLTTTASGNTAVGAESMLGSTTGGQNTTVGAFSLAANTTGNSNAAVGYSALGGNTSGAENTAMGWNALRDNTIGNANTALGYLALREANAYNNTAVGSYAMATNTGGEQNTTVGASTLYWNTVGTNNTALGTQALFSNTTGNNNTAVGLTAMYANIGGGENTALGVNALRANTSGIRNTAIGTAALFDNIEGWDNVAVGNRALENATGSNNVALGRLAGRVLVTGSNNLYLGLDPPFADESDSSYIRNVYTSNVPSGIPVYIGPFGKLGTGNSSIRFKDDVQSLGDVRAQVQALRPVSFFYKPAFDDGLHLKQYGLIAEEVAEVMPDLVARDKDGVIYSVRYQFLAPLLLAEVQRLERERAGLARELTDLRAREEADRAAVTRELADLRALVETLVRR